jgi:hypothetical protein
MLISHTIWCPARTDTATEGTGKGHNRWRNERRYAIESKDNPGSWSRNLGYPDTQTYIDDNQGEVLLTVIVREAFSAHSLSFSFRWLNLSPTRCTKRPVPQTLYNHHPTGQPLNSHDWLLTKYRKSITMRRCRKAWNIECIFPHYHLMRQRSGDMA